MKIIISVNTAWNLVNFRAGLIRALVAKGHTVVALAPNDNYTSSLKLLGCRFVPLPMDNGGSNPVKDLLLTWRFHRIFARERPNIFLGYTVKPNVYGSIVAQHLGISVINNIAGLGAVFIKDGLLVHLVSWLYKVALRRSAKVFFQNKDDRQLFIKNGLVKSALTDLLPGSGINLNHFLPAPLPSSNLENSKFRFLLAARMLRDKGVLEFVEAAKLIKKTWPHVEFCLLGFVDVKNPTAISSEEIEQWVSTGVINYLGTSDDIRIEIADADCVVLPSYREGIPRSLLEASAMGRPIITTDAIGCREVLDDGISGYLCKVRDVEDLASKMIKMLSLSAADRIQMGLQGRKKMEAQFNEEFVIDKYLEAILSIEHAMN